MSLPASEDFAGGAGALSGSWTQVGAGGTTINKDGSGLGTASAVNASVDAIAKWVADAFANDQYSQCTFNAGVSGTSYAEVAVRIGATSANYSYLFVSGPAVLNETGIIADGTQLASYTQGWSAGDTMRIEVVGTNYQGFRNGVALGAPISSVAAASGAAGIAAFWGSGATPPTFDNWQGGNLGAEVIAAIPRPLLMRLSRRKGGPPIRFQQTSPAAFPPAGSDRFVGATNTRPLLIKLEAIRRGGPPLVQATQVELSPRGAGVTGSTIYADSVSESGAAADTVDALAVYLGSVSESGSAADTIDAQAIYGLSVSESGSAADSPNATVVLTASVAESGSAADTTDAGFVFAVSVAETGSATDTTDAKVVYAAAVAESGSAVDSPNATAVFSASTSESGSALDTLNATAIFVASVAESGASADTVGAAVILGASVAEAGSAVDSTNAAVVLRAATTETGSAGDTTDATQSGSAVSVAEVGSAADTVNSTTPPPPPPPPSIASPSGTASRDTGTRYYRSPPPEKPFGEYIAPVKVSLFEARLPGLIAMARFDVAEPEIELVAKIALPSLDAMAFVEVEEDGVLFELIAVADIAAEE